MIDFLRNLEYKVYGSEDFEYTFLEDDIKAMYTQDRQTATIYSILQVWLLLFPVLAC